MRTIITFIILWLYIGWTARADTLKVAADQEIESIKQAVSMAEDGDVVMIFPGIYRESNIIIDKKLHLIGIKHPVIDGAGEDEDILVIQSDNVIVEGLHIKNVKTNYIKDLAAISVVRANSCIIKNNLITNAFFGIYLQKVNKCVVKDNKIIGSAVREASSGNALHLWYCKNLHLENNILKNHRDGIYIEFTDSTSIIGNTSENNLRYGLHFMFANHNDYVRNTFRANGAGVAVMFSKYITMKYNLFEDNWGSASYGILLKEIYDGEISDNIFKVNTIAIYGESANRLEIANNDFIDNGWGMRLLGSSMNNHITNNNFIGNTFDIVTNTSRNNNTYVGNYWSGYTGYDLDKDGVGDVPYQPVNLFSYLSERVPESIILQRSLFVYIINFAEKVAPVLTPEDLKDEQPMMKRIKR